MRSLALPQKELSLPSMTQVWYSLFFFPQIFIFDFIPGILVSFYNNVKGYVPLDQVNVSEGSTADEVQEKSKKKRKLKSVLELFRAGQIVKCRVMYCNPGASSFLKTFSLFFDLHLFCCIFLGRSPG
jgi:hypothetical protein